ncbi:MAG: hypothetical protein V1706_15260 [Pseudomonadota bacterium]
MAAYDSIPDAADTVRVRPVHVHFGGKKLIRWFGRFPELRRSRRRLAPFCLPGPFPLGKALTTRNLELSDKVMYYYFFQVLHGA